MPTFRIEKSGNYTTLDNGLIDDRRLSFRAKGLLITMLRMPDNWDFTLKGLVKLAKDGKDAVRTAMIELEDLGYVQRDPQEHDDSGRFTGGNYTVYETPFSHRGGFTDTAEPQRLTSHGAFKGNLDLNNQILNNQNNATFSDSDGEKRRRKTANWEPEEFERFWKSYPRGEDKQGARAAWDKLKPDKELINNMHEALKRASASKEWREGIGIPYAVRWIKNRRWEDEQRNSPGKKSTASSGEIQSPEVPIWK